MKAHLTGAERGDLDGSPSAVRLDASRNAVPKDGIPENTAVSVG